MSAARNRVLLRIIWRFWPSMKAQMKVSAAKPTAIDRTVIAERRRLRSTFRQGSAVNIMLASVRPTRRARRAGG